MVHEVFRGAQEVPQERMCEAELRGAELRDGVRAELALERLAAFAPGGAVPLEGEAPTKAAPKRAWIRPAEVEVQERTHSSQSMVMPTSGLAFSIQP